MGAKLLDSKLGQVPGFLGHDYSLSRQAAHNLSYDFLYDLPHTLAHDFSRLFLDASTRYFPAAHSAMSFTLWEKLVSNWLSLQLPIKNKLAVMLMKLE
uniref:Uncharacterized protein n=1 Tax=Romanomermis culicivorax TaxID=13658 RepID=A0A915IT88_ROMCU